MYKLGLGLPNDGSPIDDFVNIPFGSWLGVHNAANPGYLSQVRARWGSSAIFVVRFNFNIQDSIEDSVRQVKEVWPDYVARNGAGPLLCALFNEPDGDEGAHNPDYIGDRIVAFNVALRLAIPGILIAGPNLAHLENYGRLDSWIKVDGLWLNTGLRTAIATYDLVLVHGYADASVVSTYGNAIENPYTRNPEGRLVKNELAAKLWGFSEFSAHAVGHSAPDVRACVSEFAVRLDTYAYPGFNYNNIVCGILFIGDWGGNYNRPECIRRDPETKAGILDGLSKTHQILTPLFMRDSPVADPLPPVVSFPPDVVPAPPEVMMNPIAKRMMVFDPDNLAEADFDQMSATLDLGGIDAFSPKFWNGLTFQGYNNGDRNTYLSPVSLDGCQRIYEEFGARGKLVIPWGVPQGRDWGVEAELAIQIAQRCGGRIETDLEVGGRETATPADDFWIGPYDRIEDYYARLADKGLYVICNVDVRGIRGRYNNADALMLDRIAPYVNRFVSQSYDLYFGGVDWQRLYEDVAWYFNQIGAKEFGIVTEVAVGEGAYERAEYAQQLGAVEFASWEAGNANANLATYTGFARIPTKPYLETIQASTRPEVSDMTDEQREVLSRVATEQYRIVHKELHPLVTRGARRRADAAVTTYDVQLNDLKAAFPDVFPV